MFCLCLCLLQTTALTLELVPANGRRQHSFEKQSGRALERTAQATATAEPFLERIPRRRSLNMTNENHSSQLLNRTHARVLPRGSTPALPLPPSS
jgi:hypothetical protein